MNGQPAALAYVRGEDGRYIAICLTVLTVLTVDGDGRASDLRSSCCPTCSPRGAIRRRSNDGGPASPGGSGLDELRSLPSSLS